ncbi:MAG: hypothetical protein ACRD2L_25815, partial [Terriglobia bacterium]
MQATDLRNPSERNKLILAGALGIVAILFLWWTFFGFGSSSSNVAPRTNGQPSPSAVTRAPSNQAPTQTVVEFKGTDLDQLRPVIYEYSSVSVGEAKRNIFVYYEPPPPVQKVVNE